MTHQIKRFLDKYLNKILIVLFIGYAAMCNFMENERAIDRQKLYCEQVKKYEETNDIQDSESLGLNNYAGINCDRLNDE